MNSQHLLDEIREANLSYLLLAQQLIREDPAEAIVRLGVTEDIAEIINGLTTAQIIKMASSETLMSKLRFDDVMVWKLLTNKQKDKSITGLHAAILMASNAVDSLV